MLATLCRRAEGDKKKKHTKKKTLKKHLRKASLQRRSDPNFRRKTGRKTSIHQSGKGGNPKWRGLGITCCELVCAGNGAIWSKPGAPLLPEIKPDSFAAVIAVSLLICVFALRFRLFGSYFTRPGVRHGGGAAQWHHSSSSPPPTHCRTIAHTIGGCSVVTLPVSWCRRTRRPSAGRGRGRRWAGNPWCWCWPGSSCSPSGPAGGSCATAPADLPAAPSERKDDAAGGHSCRDSANCQQETLSKTVMRKDFCRIFAFRTEAEWSDAGLEDTLHLSLGSFGPECARKRVSLSIYCWLADWLTKTVHLFQKLNFGLPVITGRKQWQELKITWC